VRKTFEKLPETRQRAILDAAAKAFAAKGFYQANIADICRDAGISNGALYKYFHNKDDLFECVIIKTIALMEERAATFDGEKDSFFDVLRRVFDEVIPFMTEHRDYFIVYMDLGSPSMDRFARLTEVVEGPMVLYLTELLEEAKRRGEIRAGVDSGAVAYVIDNQMMLLAFSFVSEHHHRRLTQFLGHGRRELSGEEKVELVLRSLTQLLE